MITVFYSLQPITSYAVILRQLSTNLRSLMPEKSLLKLTNFFTDINFTDFIFTDIIIHAKASSVQVMSVIIMSDNVFIERGIKLEGNEDVLCTSSFP